MADNHDPVIPNDISEDANLTPQERAQKLLHFWTTENGFDSTPVRSHLHLLSATATPTATVTYAFTVTPAFCNRFGALHGGAAALIFDICTTTALATVARRGFWLDGGVSRSLNVTYLRPVMVGTECLVEGEVVQAGRRLCTLRGVLRRKSDGVVLCTADHGKVTVEPSLSSRI